MKVSDIVLDPKLEKEFTGILKNGLRDLYRAEIKSLGNNEARVETPKKTVEIPVSQSTKARRDSIRRRSLEEINNQISSQWKTALRKKEPKKNNYNLIIGVGSVILVDLLVVSYVSLTSPFQGNEPAGKVPPKTTVTLAPVENVKSEGSVSPQTSPAPTPCPTPTHKPKIPGSPAPQGTQPAPPVGTIGLPAPVVPNSPADIIAPPILPVIPQFDQTDGTPGGYSQLDSKTPDSGFKGESKTEESQSNNTDKSVSPAENPVGTVE